MSVGRVARGRWVLAIMGVLTVLLVCLSIWLSARLTTPSRIAAGLFQPLAAPVTAPVERRELRQMVQLEGTILPPAPVEVRAPGRVRDGQVVVTAAPRRPGRRVSEGDRLVEVSGRPVFLLHGATPMYRNLRYGVAGPDVLQLQLALARLGFRPGDRSGWFGPGTKAAVRRFYRAHGYQPAVELVDRVTGEPVPVAVAEGSAARRRPVRRLVVPWSELVFVRRSPTWVVSAPFSVGQRPDRPVLTLATGSPSVGVSLDDHEWGLVRRGARIMVEPGRGAAPLDMTISAVEAAPIAAPSAAERRGGKVGKGAALLKTTRPLPVAYVGRTVKVTVEAQRTAGEVLTVPLAAMWSRADGSIHVTVASVDGTREVSVVPGVSVDGMVEVITAGGMLNPGDLVVIGDQARMSG